MDYDVHGIVGIRIIGASDSERVGVERQLGVRAVSLTRAPDIIIRFKKGLQSPDRLTFLSHDTAFTERAFFLTAGRDRRPVMQVPFANLGHTCELIVAGGLAAVPLLVPIVNLTALSKGYVPMHASAFIFDGVGTLIAGGAGAGKTGVLLGFMSGGASFVGDDWVLVDRDGDGMLGLATPIEVKKAYLTAIPGYRRRLERQTLFLRGIKALIGIERRLPGVDGKSIVARTRARIRAAVDERLKAVVAPRRLFGAEWCIGQGPLDVVFLGRSSNAAGIEVRAIAPNELIEQALPLLEYEWGELHQKYQLYCSAFPEERNRLLDEREELLSGRVRRVLAGKKTFIVSYPSPVPVQEICGVLAPFLLGQQR